MTYAETLDYLFSRLPMFSRIGAAAYKDNLDNIIHLCEALDHPERKFRSIHVAGTNGKGSVSHMLAAILQTAGYKTGLHTSPHLKDFRERIKVNGIIADEDFVIRFTEKIKPVIEVIDPSFFEISVAMAFEYFADQKVDIAVIETGLGGRLDSTNIIMPELSVITNIGWDHMNLLGDSLDKIAREKAGIIKQHIPIVVGEVLPETLPVFESVAAERSAPLFIANQLHQALETSWEKHELIVQVAQPDKTDHESYHLDLPGLYQAKNLVTVLETVKQLQHRDWKITPGQVQEALRHVKKLTGLHGRWELIQEHPMVILDVGHNEAGIKQIVEQLELTDYHSLHMIIGMVKDKEIARVLRLLPKNASYYFTEARIPRALPAGELQTLAEKYDLHGKSFTNVNIALNDALARARKEDLILVCGSVFLVGEVER